MLRTQRGSSLVELLAAMVVISMLMGVFGSALYHFLVVPALQGDHLAAVSELRFALGVVQTDAVQAQSFTGGESPDYGYFSWDYYDPDTASIVTHTVTYSYDESEGRLLREQSMDSSSTAIASNIASEDDVSFVVDDDGDTVTVTITVTVESGRGSVTTETGIRNVEMRVTP